MLIQFVQKSRFKTQEDHEHSDDMIFDELVSFLQQTEFQLGRKAVQEWLNRQPEIDNDDLVSVALDNMVCVHETIP